MNKLDTGNQEFYKDVYTVVAGIPEGTVTTYGDIALLLGRPQNSRMVGRALKLVPHELSLPCHRVVNSQGRLAPDFIEQRQLLLAEDVQFKKNGEVDMKKSRWKWELISM